MHGGRGERGSLLSLRGSGRAKIQKALFRFTRGAASPMRYKFVAHHRGIQSPTICPNTMHRLRESQKFTTNVCQIVFSEGGYTACVFWGRYGDSLVAFSFLFFEPPVTLSEFSFLFSLDTRSSSTMDGKNAERKRETEEAFAWNFSWREGGRTRPI